jgi:peptidoglycan/LPS O-acetylase OafA/YrhL
MTSRGAIPSLDGIRALAVLLVFFAHGGFEGLVPGGLGVTTFFVLSGFLITTLMRREHAVNGRIRYGSFYLRRLLRLMPPLLVVVAIAAVLAASDVIGGDFTVGGLLAALFYFGNYFVIAHDFNGLPAGIGVVWSLAIEEHFYLVFPPLAALLLRTGRTRTSFAVLASLCAAIAAWRCWLVWRGWPEAHLTMATDTRADAILIGCLMALCWNPWLDRVPARSATADLGIAATCIAVLVATLLYRNEVFRLTARYTVQSIAIAPLIYLAVARASYRPFRWLNARPLVYLGTISYTVYLSHHVILEGMVRHWPTLSRPWLMIGGAVLTLIVAEAMRRWVEQPFAKLRLRLHAAPPSRTIPVAAVIGVAQ